MEASSFWPQQSIASPRRNLQSDSAALRNGNLFETNPGLSGRKGEALKQDDRDSRRDSWLPGEQCTPRAV